MNEEFTETALCDFCKEPMAYWADNNAAGLPFRYCVACEDRRADKFGCALMLAEGAQCEDGICGCGGSGVYL